MKVSQNCRYPFRKMRSQVLAEQEVSKILEAIHRKSEESDIEFDVLFEVFKRGWYSYVDNSRLSEQEIGFNRVNSFLAGGLARKLDEDLLADEMGISTPADNLVNDNDTPLPGEILKSRLRTKK